MDNKGFSFRKRLTSFRYAFNGIRLLIRYEHNAWIHCFAAVCAILAGAYFHLSQGEWIAVLIVIGGVFSAEAVNTAIESMADFISPGYHETIKKVKDLQKKEELSQYLYMKLGGKASDLRIFHINQYLKWICPWLITIKRDRLEH